MAETASPLACQRAADRHRRIRPSNGALLCIDQAHRLWSLNSIGDHHGNRSQRHSPEPWNKGKIVGQRAPFKLKDIWALRVRLQMENRVRELALFNLGIDSKLRGCDLVALKVRDVCHGDQVASRAVVMQHKTQRPVQFEIAPAARDAVWITTAGLKSDDFLFPSRIHDSPRELLKGSAKLVQRDMWGQGVYAEGAAAVDPAGILQQRCSSTAAGRVSSCRAGHVDLASCRSSMGYEAPSGGRADRSTQQE